MDFHWGKLILSQLSQLGSAPDCAVCQRPARNVLCPDCYRQLEDCRLPHTQISTGSELTGLAWGKYTGILKQALACLKYNHQPSIAEILGQQLGLLWLETPTHRPLPIVVPIPLHKSRELQRGYNQAALIAKSFCHVTGLKLATSGLVRIRATEAQFSLPAVERFANVDQAFYPGPYFAKRPCGEPVLLLDDIYTTGATALSAYRTLKKLGCQVAGIVVIAKA